MALERLQKILAHAGVASRRAAEELIVNGHVRVNGRIIRELGARADTRKDRVEVDGKRLVAERHMYFLFHKPRAMVTTMHDPEGRPSLVDVFGRFDMRLYPVGRLDFHTSGALIVTNDGELTDALLHPRHGVPKEYVAKVRGHLEVKALQALRSGVKLDDGRTTKKAEVFVIREEENTTWLQITITEGQNRQIHRMGDAVGHPVMRLSRVSFAGISTEGLKPGDYRELTERELEKLKKDYGSALHRPPRRDADEVGAGVKRKKKAGTGYELRMIAEERNAAKREREEREAAEEERAPSRVTRGRDARRPAARDRDRDERAPAARGRDERKPVTRGRDERRPATRGRDDRNASPRTRDRDDRAPIARARDERKPASRARDDRKPLTRGRAGGNKSRPAARRAPSRVKKR